MLEGTAADRYTGLREEFARRLEHEELGASLAVYEHGELVVDLWGGWADEARTRPWERDTITNTWSCTKTVTALAVLLLVDRGDIDLDAPVARYWPEFAAASKEGVLVKHLLSHTSGVPGWADPVTAEFLYDTEGAAAALAAQAPWWPAGTASGYHLLDYGHLLGELVRRIDGRTLGTFVREELAEPLGADYAIGLDPADFARIANVVPPPPTQLDFSQLPPDAPALRTLGNPYLDATVTWTDAWRTAELGGANGHGNARSLGRIQSLLTHGGEQDGRRYLSPATIERVFEQQSDGIDLVLFQPLRFGIGYALPHPAVTPYLPGGSRVAFWGGWGGSLILNDVERGVTFSYVMNRMSEGIIGSERSNAYAAALYAALA
ncbi:serine hydrolase domain-containing protein [Protaetiibacter intestinalis]|uniref:Class A beta-lactamase-related serine hydrolase n=1 Tax=Protaetiibacter intestinalis TaxID=2419774 RepID=A0A387BAW3_9MICO|nr:serine hydrolase domain-containing protein [Protaetiibacter intestinalis]AYF98265.1 class A beta-lactamase-related serine hydrolase [Protaetiibacter intestinalis]